MIVATLLFTAFFALTLGTPLSRNLQLHEKRDSPPSGFVPKGAASPDHVLSLRIALAPSDPAGLEAALYDVSTPTSPNYRNYLTREEAASYVAPTAETLSVVTAWLAENGLTAETLTPAGDWLAIEVPVSQANELFDAAFTVFEYESTGQETIRTLAYSVPAALKGAIDVVHPTVTFIEQTSKIPIEYVPTRRNEKRQASSCASQIVPSCLQQLYGIPTTAASQSSNKIGVTGYSSQWPQTQDLKLFLSKYRTDISSSTTFTVQDLDGGSDPQGTRDAGDEADLDVEYTVGLATGVPVTFLSVGSNNNDGIDGFLDTINYFLGESSPPQVITTSYGFYEKSFSSSVSLANKLCNAYAQLGARGVSILFASGDGGVSGSQSQSCTKFQPTFPSTCPYLTSVGATIGIKPEVGVDFSSGGFSNIFSVPSYQAAAVSAYIKSLGSTYSGLYNTSGRGFPDVSVQGSNFLIGYQNKIATVNGTSCSSPTFASIIALLNDELLAAGQAPLGFLNPWLYSNASSAFTDITSGNNPGCGTKGFYAKAGWDPITGLGTPIFSALRTAAGL